MALRVEYYLRETFLGLRRNGLLAFAAVSTAFIALFLLGGALLAKRQVDLVVEQTTARVEVSVFLRDEISPSQRDHLSGLLTEMPEVAEVHYESKAEAYERFRRIFRTQRELVENVTANALPASFRVKLENPEEFQVVAARLEGQPGIDKVVDHRETLEKLFRVTRGFNLALRIMTAVMLVAAGVLIGNTVRMAVFARRKEIGIMRLVGATNWFIRMPFMIEGLLQGLIGAGAAILGLFIFKVTFVDGLLKNAVGLFLPLIGTPDLLWPTVPVLLTVGVLLSVTASFLAMLRFLEV